MKNLIEKFKNAWKEAGNLLKNTEAFVEAVCLLILAYAGYWMVFNVELRREYQWAVLFASLVVGLKGAYLFIKHINGKTQKTTAKDLEELERDFRRLSKLVDEYKKHINKK